MDEDRDEQEEGREMDESITKELRDCIFYCPHMKGVADRIDARFDRELRAKQDEMDGLKADMSDLQAKPEASILLPMDESESITKELRSAAVTRGAIRIDAWDSIVVMSESKRDGIADGIDARFTHELEAKQEEIDALRADNAKLQARLDASIPVPVDADGVPWTCADVDKSFSLADGDKTTEGTVREIAYAWPREGWWIVDQYDTHYPADRCRHVVPGPPETIEDVRKSCDSTVSYLASVSGMGWHDVETFSKDVHEQLDRAYACGKRDGAGIEASRLHHVATEPTDSQERIDADARKVSCDYFGRSAGWCHGCPAENDENCAATKALDLLLRQRELDGAGEQR